MMVAVAAEIVVVAAVVATNDKQRGFKMKKPILVSSNENKLKEFSRFGLDLDIEKGRDLKEVMADPLGVIVYKALEAGPDRVVEDTTLIIDGTPIVDIKWRLKELLSLPADKQPVIQWVVILGYNTGTEIRAFYGTVMCKLSGLTPESEVSKDAFGFDPYLCPMDERHSFYELEKLGLKDKFSPRKLAAEAFMANHYGFSIEADKIKPWTGAYQNENG